MKNLAKIISLALVCALIGCQTEIPMVDSDIDNVYTIPRMQALRLCPEFSGDAYEWIENDSIVSRERNYTFCRGEIGTYRLTLKIADHESPFVQHIAITVYKEENPFSPYITKVYEFCPAPGQFVNELPPYDEGDTQADMLAKAEKALVGNTSNMISLGGFGGFVTFGFDHCVMNGTNRFDFRILGNAIYSTTENNRKGGSAESGIVLVSMDKNMNGEPDDEFYELAGSEYSNPATRHNYVIEYQRPSTPTADIVWRDSEGASGVVERNQFHTQSYFPQWLDAESLTFEGTLLPRNAEEKNGEWTLYAFDWGYADNHPNSDTEKTSFDIAWAVDADGNAVHLPYINFVRVYTALHQTCGRLGETSTEVMKAIDLNLINNE